MVDPQARAATGSRVLVVEDELLIRMFIADVLRDAGFVVLEAFNGDEAVAILAAGAGIDLVFTDVKMPGSCDGMALLNFIQRTQPELPVVLTSGHLEPTVALSAGAVGFLAKPCDLNVLVETVRAELEFYA